MLEKTTLAGTPYEQGLTHGEEYSNEIENNVDFYIKYFAEKGIDEETVLETSDKIFPYIQNTNPIYAEGIKGISEGSGLSLNEITMVNIRHTISYSAFSNQIENNNDSITPDDGCTSFGLDSSVTVSNHTYIGQNWDWYEPVELFIMDMRYEDAPNFIALTEAGLFGGKYGLNEMGIGYAANGMTTPRDGKNYMRTPSHVRNYNILRSERFDQAIKSIISEKRSTARNYLVGQSNGEIVNFETAPKEVEYLYTKDGIITHANHFEKRWKVQSQLEQEWPDSVFRSNRLRRFFEEIDTDITENEIKIGLKDHFSHPKSICRHSGGGDKMVTKSSLIMDLDKKQLLATDGPPCSNEYKEFTVQID
jgi:isopenicillin-N N-acyltransferase-like protein